jgi:Ca2+-binding RTX toxin-like protein
LNDLVNNTTLTLLGNHAGIVTANIKTNTANDVLNLVFANTAAATQTVAEIDGDAVIDTLNITSGGGGANIITAFDIDVQNVIVTGNQALTITAFTDNEGATEQLEIFNASALTGALTVNFTNADNALTVTGSATAANTIILSAGNDTYTGGAGVDTVTGAGGNDTITLGGGADVFIIAAIAATGTNQAKDIIKDFVVGTDKLDLNLGLVDGAGATAAASDFLDVAAGATTTTFTGNTSVAIFEFSNAADVLGEGVTGTFNALTATGAELEAAVIEQLATDVAITQVGADTEHLIFVMYDEAGNAVIVNYSDSGVATEDTVRAADFFEFVVLEGVAQGALTASDFI